MKAQYNDGFEHMTTSLEALGDASGALGGGGGGDPASPAVGRAILGAIRACAQSSHGAHLVSFALERALAESELRHKQGAQFLIANLVDPVIKKVGGSVAAAVIKCCVPGVGPELLLPSEQEGSGGGGGADPFSAPVAAFGATAAAAAQNKYLAEMMKLDESDLAAAPELVSGALLGRLAKLVKGMNATTSSLPELEHRYHKAYQLAQKTSIEVVNSAEALFKRANAADLAAAAATSPEAAAAAADATRGQQNAEIGSLSDLLDKCNDDFNRFFQQVDEELSQKLGRSLGDLSGAATARIEKAYEALSASMDRHQAKELRDAMMLRSLRRIADAGQGGSDGRGSSAAAALAAVLDGYDRAVKEQQGRLAAAQSRCAPPPTAASAAAAAAVAAAPDRRAANGPANKNKNIIARSTNNKKNKKNGNRNKNANGSNGDVRPAPASAPVAPASAPVAPDSAPVAPDSAPVAPASAPASFAPLYELFFGHW